MNRRFLLFGLLLSGVIGLQTIWLIRSNLQFKGQLGASAHSLLILQHLPAAALELYVRPGNAPVWVVIVLDCLLWGFGIAWAIRWLRRMLSSHGGT